MNLHIVTSQVGGYAREDAKRSSLVGAFTNPALAQRLSVIHGFSSEVHAVEVDAIRPGLLADAEAMRIDLPPATPWTSGKLHVVTDQIGGYAREDAKRASVVGAFGNPALAQKLAIIHGFGSQVHEVEVDVIPPGLLADAKEMHITLPPLALPAAEPA